MKNSILFTILTIFIKFIDADSCYFPLEFQGEFLTQSLSSREIAYNSISILFDSIPLWGFCKKRIENNVILVDNTSGPSECFRCLSLVPRSRNVLQIHVTDPARCYSTQEEATLACPTSRDVRHRRTTEMMLYKTRDFYGESAISKTYCPLNGAFKFTYSVNDGTEDDLECNEPLSEATDCPSGYKFDLKFKGCSFPDFDMSFQCLGSWDGDNGETYISLLDTKLPQLGEEARPRYRCGIFKKDSYTGLTHLALSSDSTCVHHLYSSQDGYETLHLEQIQNKSSISVEEPRCSFASWLHGSWDGFKVRDRRGRFEYRDEKGFETYKGSCYNDLGDSTYVVETETECGAYKLSCIQFRKRDENVMEFRIGKTRNGGHRSSCEFPSQWITKGREDPNTPSLCPLTGEYEGVIPDAEGLCARSKTDCKDPKVMAYTVYNCHNDTEIYEERRYRCYGQWKDDRDGLVYTFTRRLDLPGTECFVGITIDEMRNVVTEAGSTCERGKQPLKFGMTLNRVRSCPANTPTTKKPVLSSKSPGNTHYSVVITKKKPEQIDDTTDISGFSSGITHRPTLVFLFFVHYFFFFH